eukprot:TRINITY_DN14126_c0_g2_i1.p2 TRINITY_DN14126_c0_g2~~TRINITY_DN14126_c0_g2_i1.p2  ORF type:complete len:381 (+),score=105.10 TRINITY_DN14126_c0_g2_i1:87-1229(+)
MFAFCGGSNLRKKPSVPTKADDTHTTQPVAVPAPIPATGRMGGIIFTNGTSSAGKSTAAQEFLKLVPNAKYIAEDQMYTFDNGVPTHAMTKEEKAHKMTRYAIEHARAGRLVLVEQVDLFVSILADANEQLKLAKVPALYALFYCSLKELPERIHKRNTSGDKMEARSFWRTLVHFGIFFTGVTHEPEDGRYLEKVSRAEFEDILRRCREYDPYGTAEHRDQRQVKLRGFLLKMLNFGTHKHVYIVPRFQPDVLLDSSKDKPKRLAKTLYKQWRKHDELQLPSVISTLRADPVAVNGMFTCMECQIPRLAMRDEKLTTEYCKACMLNLQEWANVDFTEPPPCYAWDGHGRCQDKPPHYHQHAGPHEADRMPSVAIVRKDS